MPPTEIAEFENIAASLAPQAVAIAGGDRQCDLGLYQQLREKPYVRQCILVGDRADMRAAAERLGIDLAEDDVVATNSQEETAARILELAQTNRADVIQKGNISTPILNRKLVKMRTRDTMSLATVFQADCFRDGAPMIMTDAGVSAILNYSRMTGLIKNSVEIARAALNIDRPRVALLAGNEKPMPALPSTMLARDLAAACWDDAIVYGPLSFDLAVDAESVRLKEETLPEGSPLFEVAGMADVLVNPALDAANIMYKMLMRMAESGLARMACVTVGIKAPYVISSRSDPARSKVDSIALACIYADCLHRKAAATSPAPSAPAGDEPIHRILTINPGSTSTKLSLFENRRCMKNFEVAQAHQSGLKGAAFDAEVEQYIEHIEEFLGDDAGRIDAVVGRGGFLNRENQHIEGGVYEVCTVTNDTPSVHADIVAAVRDHPGMDHASNLGVPIAARLAEDLKVPAFCVDPVVADELQNEARYSGYAPIERRSVGHVLSVRAAARKAAGSIGKPFEKCRFVVAHLGGGISVAAVSEGRVVDIGISLLGEGCFTPQRAGVLPQDELIDLCYSGQFERNELKTELTKRAGLRSYLGEDAMPEIEGRIESGDEEARAAVDAMIYQVAKDIGAMSISVAGPLDGLVFTGGMARSERIVRGLKSRVGHLGHVVVYPENLEMEAMATGVLPVLEGRAEAKIYRLMLRRSEAVTG